MTTWHSGDSLLGVSIHEAEEGVAGVARRICSKSFRNCEISGIMFQSLKEKISDTLWSLSSDDADKNLADLVARGTSETLIAPEWGVNMQLVDIVNQQPT